MFPDTRTTGRVKSLFQAVRSFIIRHKFISVSLPAIVLLAVFIGPLIGKGPARERAGRERDSAQQIKKRAQWFFHQRAYPLGHIPAGARVRAVEHLEQMRANSGTFMQRFAAQHASAESASGVTAQQIAINMTSWTPIGPQPTTSAFFGFTSGRVNALAVDPCDASGNTIYAGGAQGGVWKTTNGGTNWTELTDAQLSISTGSIALDPVPGDCTGGHTGAIYYGTGEENFAYDSFYGAGVLISHDGGNTWVKDNTFVTVTSGTPSTITAENADAAGPYIGSIGVDPATTGANQVLLAAIQGASSTISSGIWRSTNGGMNWTKMFPTASSQSPNDFATGVAFDPTDATGNTVYAALGIPFCASNPCDQAGDEELDNGVYKSSDSGQTWTRLTGLDTAAEAVGLSVDGYGRITIATGPAVSSGNPGELIVSIADITTESSGLLAVFESTNGGSTFTELPTPAFCNEQCFYDMAAIISPTNPQLIFLGGGPSAEGSGISQDCGEFPADDGISAAIRSNDGGNSWNDISCDNSSGTFIHVDTHAFAFSPNGNFYIGNDGGVWSSANVASGTPGAQTWTDLNTTLNLTQFYPGNSIHPSNPEVGFAGAQDNGTQMFTGDLNWADTEACGDGGWTAIDPTTPSTVYAACEDVGQEGIVNKNQLDGVPGTDEENWIILDTPAMDADNADFVPPLVLDSSDSQNLYFGTYRVWQSTNGGISWNIASQDLTGFTTNPDCGGGVCVVTSLSVAPNSSNTVYAGTDVGAIWVSTNATSAAPTFTEIDQANTPERVVTQVVASAANSSVAFAAFSGFSGFTDEVGHLFETTNGGASWTDISCQNVGNCGSPLATDLPNTPVNDVVVDPNDTTNNTVYVATDVGVFVTTNGGTSWSELATGLPHVECTSLKLNNTARALRVGTHGRGDWDLQLPGLPTSALTGISPTSTSAGTSGITLTLTGQGFATNPTVNFGSTPLPSSGSGTQLTVAVPSSALASSSEVAVSVSGAQNSLNFGVEGPVPMLSGASPGSITAGSNVTLTVTGSSFTANSQVVWTPTSGVNENVSAALAQLPGGTSTSFTVTVPASLLSSTVGNVIPLGAPKSRPGGPAPWLFLALIVAALGAAGCFAMPRRRRAVLGATVGMVVLLALTAGCSSPQSLPPPTNFGSSVTVAVNVINPGPGGGLSNSQLVTVNP
ncbi:MAG: IPT/TIG domain-containing protein [Candidatus Acidiferrales bacterium]